MKMPEKDMSTRLSYPHFKHFTTSVLVVGT